MKDGSTEQSAHPQSLVKAFAVILENVCRIYRRKMKTDCTAQILRLFLAFDIRIYVSVVANLIQLDTELLMLCV